MYLLDPVSICDKEFLPVWNVVGTIIKALWIGIPVLLIILGTIDLGKAVVSSKEDEVKKAKKSFISRLIYAILVFAVVWIVGILLGFVSKFGINKTDNVDEISTNSWKCCWNMAIRGTTENCDKDAYK